jgi:hypothetical protein
MAEDYWPSSLIGIVWQLKASTKKMYQVCFQTKPREQEVTFNVAQASVCESGLCKYQRSVNIIPSILLIPMSQTICTSMIYLRFATGISIPKTESQGGHLILGRSTQSLKGFYQFKSSRCTFGN